MSFCMPSGCKAMKKYIGIYMTRLLMLRPSATAKTGNIAGAIHSGYFAALDIGML